MAQPFVAGTPTGARGLFMARRAWATFGRLLKERPLLTNMAVSGMTMTSGDLIAQVLERRRLRQELPAATATLPAFDLQRTLIAVGWNTVLFTPVFLVWFRRLDRLFPGGSSLAALKKVCINQLVITVPINAGFLAYTTSVETLTKTPGGWQQKIETFDAAKVAERVELQFQSDLLGIFKRSCQFWFPVNFLNFLFVPATHRVLPTIFASTCWSVYLSLTAHRHGDVGTREGGGGGGGGEGGGGEADR